MAKFWLFLVRNSFTFLYQKKKKVKLDIRVCFETLFESEIKVQGQSSVGHILNLSRKRKSLAKWCSGEFWLVSRFLLQNSLFVSHTHGLCVTWGNQSWCLARKKNVGRNIYILNGNSWPAQLNRQRQKNSLSLCLCELSTANGGRRIKIEGASRRPRTFSTQRQLVEKGWTLANLGEDFWIATGSFFVLSRGLSLKI